MVVIRFGHDWEENCMQMDQVCQRGTVNCIVADTLWHSD